MTTEQNAVSAQAEGLASSSAGGAPAAMTPATKRRRGRRAMMRRKRHELYAALDLGTNNCRLLIARPAKVGQFRIIESYSQIVRLGEGLSQTGRLAEAAMQRALAALAECRARLKKRRIAHQWLVATAACRKAANGAEFVSRVRGQLGLELDIIAPETEARLAVSGCGGLVDRAAGAVALFDIGGGSTELALLNMAGKSSPRLAEHIIGWLSLPVGVVSLAEQFGAQAQTLEGLARMKAYVSALLADFLRDKPFPPLPEGTNLHLLGASGTVTMIAGLALRLDRYDRRRIDGIWLSGAAIEAAMARLANMSMAERQAHPCIGPGRADLLPAGCAILQAIRALWPQAKLRVADRGLREGILTELMLRQNAWSGQPRRRKKRRKGIRHKA